MSFETSIFKNDVDFLFEKMGDLKDNSGFLIREHDYRVFLYLFFEIKDEISIIKTDKENILRASLFHDLLEDTSVTEEELLKLTNSTVVGLVKEMTIDFNVMSMSEIMDKIDKTSEFAKMIKCADIYDNVSKAILLYKTASAEFYTFYSELLGNYKILLKRWILSDNHILARLASKSAVLIEVYFETYQNSELKSISIKDN